MKQKKVKQKIICIAMILLSILCINVSTNAHSGRTDANGGHKDNKNASGLGSYHYHCGGNPAHLHPNGVCPYSSKSKTKTTTKKENTNTKSNTNTKTTTNKGSSKTTKIEVSNVEIDRKNVTLLEGETTTLTCNILPTNATDKSIIWKSTNEDILTVQTNGMVTAKKVGVASITANSANGKSDTIAITVIAKQKQEETKNVVQTVNTNQNATNTMDKQDKEEKENSNIVGGIAALGILGGGCYLGYRKKKNNKINK